jgi:polycomb-like protein 2
MPVIVLEIYAFLFQVDLVTEQCLIKFGDDTESWSSFKDLSKLTLPDSDLLCVICKKSQPKTDNEIIVCDRCSRGYHHLCHQVCVCVHM